jgi:WD40 repeat protein
MFIEEERMGGKVIIGGRTTSKEGDSLFTMPANVLVKEETTPLYYNNRVNDGSDLSMKDAVELTGSKWVQESSVARAQAFVSNLSENDIFLQRRKNDDDGGGGDDDHGSLDSPSETLFSSQVQYLSVDAQECVAKVVPDRIYSVAFHPCSHKLIATTGDKKGYLGLWDVDATLTDSSSGVAGGGGDDMDGVYLFKPHSGAINSLQWNQSGSKLLSQSYDGTIRLMDVERQVFVDAFAAYDD